MKRKRKADQFKRRLGESFVALPRKPWTETLAEADRERERLRRETEMSPPPSGTVRKVDATEDAIIIWPSGDLTICGEEAWRLYESLENFCFDVDGTTVRRVRKDMRHLLRYPVPCNDVRPRLKHAIRVEAALLGAGSWWFFTSIGPVAVRLAPVLPEEVTSR